MENFIVVQPLFSTLRPFDPQDNSITTWLQLFEEFCMVNNVPAEPVNINGEIVAAHNHRRALFLSHLGGRAYEVLRRACLPLRPNQRSIQFLSTILVNRFEPPGLVATNRFSFWQRSQRDGESAAQYVSCLQDLASKCNFGIFFNEAIKDKLITGIKNNDTRRKLLSTPNLTFVLARDIILQDEAIRAQAQAISQSITLNYVNKKPSYSRSQNNQQPSSGYQNSRNPSRSQHQGQHQGQHQVQQHSNHHQAQAQVKNSCHRCGEMHSVKTCRYISYKCRKCQKVGHLARVCRSRPVRVQNVQNPQPEHHQQFQQDDQAQLQAETMQQPYELVNLLQCSEVSNCTF